MAKSAKRAKATKAAKKTAAKKRPSKKAAKRPAANRAAMMMAAAGGGALGCCVITGLDGPNKQFPHITQQKCNQIADELGGNPKWYKGECA